jgi:hypothetical protein
MRHLTGKNPVAPEAKTWVKSPQQAPGIPGNIREGWMPLVFVHGVATRQTDKYAAQVAQRNALFQRLVMSDDKAIYDPDWGSEAVHFGKGGWVPIKGTAEAYDIGGPPLAVQGPSAAAVAAQHNLEQAVDLALASLLAQNAASGAALNDEELSVFEAAVRYLEDAAD